MKLKKQLLLLDGLANRKKLSDDEYLEEVIFLLVKKVLELEKQADL